MPDITSVTNQYFSKIKSFISSPPIDELNRIYIKLILLCLSIIIIYSWWMLNTPIDYKAIRIRKNINRTKPNAFIITSNCRSLRYKTTVQNIHRVFPNFFNILCFVNIPLTDPRIHTRNITIWKKFSSNLLVFIEIWTYEIQEYSKHNPYEWSFIFEDDVNFNPPSKVNLPNYVAPLQELMNNPEIQMKDGFIYLGICGPDYDNNSQVLISKNTKDTLISRKGYGYCLHASGITAKRSKLFWTEISSYRPNPADASLDLQIRHYLTRSKNHFYIFGINFHYPPGTGHFGIAYQDRGRFSTTVT